MSFIVVFLIIVIVIALLALIIWKGSFVNASDIFSGTIDGNYIVVQDNPKVLVNRSLSKDNVKYCQSIVDMIKRPDSKLWSLLTDLTIYNLPVDNIEIIGYVSGDTAKKETIKLSCIINSHIIDVNGNNKPFKINVIHKFLKYDGLVDMYDVDSMDFIGFEFPLSTLDALVQYKNFHKKIGNMLKSITNLPIECENIKTFKITDNGRVIELVVNYNGERNIVIVIKDVGRETEEIHIVGDSAGDKQFSADIYTEEQDELTEHLKGKIPIKAIEPVVVSEQPVVAVSEQPAVIGEQPAVVS